MVPSESLDAVALTDAVKPAADELNEAVGGWLAGGGPWVRVNRSANAPPAALTNRTVMVSRLTTKSE